nr:leucine-rich repeat protein kinase family protein [Tanacetum cinerariifolium]
LIKARINSVVVPVGSLQYGVCRHRALLKKYLCDRVKPRVPCELVRGYLDFSPHAWNVVAVKRGNSEVQFVVDACRPQDYKARNRPGYFYRYIPLSRINGDATPDVDSPFPSLSKCEKIKEGGSTTLMKCNLGSVEAADKVRTLKVSGSSADEFRCFDYKSIGEVRLLSVLKHACIVKILGHQISTKWLPSEDGTPEDRILQSAIFMEHIKEGSLKDYIEKLARSGDMFL